MKRVLSIQDLSCLGRCSLTVTLPVISAMGSQCAVLPTAVLSTHTGFPGPHIHPLTQDIPEIVRHWQQLDVSYDAVGVGYMANEQQAHVVLPILQHYRSKGSLIVADPAMGDHGKLYSGLSSEHVQAMKEIARCADILLPNLTEAALLTGLPYRETVEDGYLQELGQGLLELGVSTAIITGFLFPNGQIGFYGAEKNDAPFSYREQYIPKQLHGTGDLFAAVFIGGLMAAKSPAQAAAFAADFVRRCVEANPEVTPFGVEFDTQLPTFFD